ELGENHRLRDLRRCWYVRRRTVCKQSRLWKAEGSFRRRSATGNGCRGRRSRNRNARVDLKSLVSASVRIMRSVTTVDLTKNTEAQRPQRHNVSVNSVSLCFSTLVIRRLIHAIDHDHVNHRLRGFQLQTELLL